MKGGKIRMGWVRCENKQKILLSCFFFLKAFHFETAEICVGQFLQGKSISLQDEIRKILVLSPTNNSNIWVIK